VPARLVFFQGAVRDRLTRSQIVRDARASLLGHSAGREGDE